MKISQLIWKDRSWVSQGPDNSDINPQIGFIFGNIKLYQNTDVFEQVSKIYPTTLFTGCSTAGEIANNEIWDDSLVFTLIEFNKTTVKGDSVLLSDADSIYEAGKMVAKKLPQKELRHIIVLSEGIDVNGSELVRGITEVLPKDVPLTGGLAGDGNRFESTFVLLGSESARNKVVVIGFYGDSIRIGHGCFGGWDTFGPDRIITKSEQNILYRLDDQPALQLYKEYLGDFAKNLPSSGLLFPLCILNDEKKQDWYALFWELMRTNKP